MVGILLALLAILLTPAMVGFVVAAKAAFIACRAEAYRLTREERAAARAAAEEAEEEE